MNFLKKKICFFQPHPAYGSVEEYLSIIINGLVDLNIYDITFFCPDSKKADKLCRDIKNGPTIIRYPKIENGIKEIAYFYNHIKKIKPDIVHFNDPALSAMIAANLAGIRLKIITFHTPTLEVEYNWRGRLAWKMAFSKDLNVVATTDSLKLVMTRRWNIAGDRITAINYGLNSARLKANLSRDQIRRNLGISLDKFVLINVARLCSQKSQDVLIRSIRFLPEDLYDKIVLLIAGSGELQAELKALISELNLQDKVFLLGHRQDIPNLLSCSDLFVLSSSFEGACFALIEAMALGIPIVATDIDGVRDTVVNGKTGILIHAISPDKLANTIEELYKDSEKRMAFSHAGKKRFQEEFQSQKMIDSIVRLYNKLMGVPKNV